MRYSIFFILILLSIFFVELLAQRRPTLEPTRRPTQSPSPAPTSLPTSVPTSAPTKAVVAANEFGSQTVIALCVIGAFQPIIGVIVLNLLPLI
jgi:hypothetical protein